ncbi:Hypothetical predicted protein [Olea europaea subsp. europaea]|uniref:Uncharacterized protein n=1 Tax=Olea europaea subsp. europaea TaxID=158383 RepID=A0A8S0SX84_OLEEU|nr:Hypothetical predicted protein [Olea europaea subsp. europaea]
MAMVPKTNPTSISLETNHFAAMYPKVCMKQISMSVTTMMKKLQRTGVALHEKVSRFGASNEWKYREPASEGSSHAHSQKRFQLLKPCTRTSAIVCGGGNGILSLEGFEVLEARVACLKPRDKYQISNGLSVLH